jgi:DNA mismatch repair protein MutS
MNKNSFYNEFFNYQVEYSKKYNNCICLIQCGDFYEYYADPIHFPITETYINILRDITNFRISRKVVKEDEQNYNKSPLFLGFPIHAFDNIVQKILDNHYDIVLIKQNVNNPKDRFVDKIITKGTYNNTNTIENNYFCCIYHEVNEKNNKYSMIGLSLIDFSTGECFIEQYLSNILDSDKIYNTLYKELHSYPIGRCIVYTNHKYLIEDCFPDINVIYYNLSDINPEYSNPNYQDIWFDKIFSNNVISMGIEHKHYTLISLILLIQYIYDFDKSILTKINTPKCLEYNTKMYIDSRATTHLDIEGLYKIISKYTLTNMGKRKCKYRLYNPIYDIDELHKRQQFIHQIQQSDISFVKRKLLSLYDIEKIYRRIITHNISFQDFIYLYKSLQSCLELFTYLNYDTLECNKLITTLEYYFNFELQDDKFIIFNKTIFNEIDELLVKRDTIIKSIKDFSIELTKEMGENIELKYKTNEVDAIYYETTKKRAEKLPSNKYKLKFQKSTCKIIPTFSEEYYFKLLGYENQLESIIQNKLIEVCDMISITNELLELVCDIDISYMNVILLDEKYCIPVLHNDKQYMKGVECRHPIVERFENEKFIPNDIDLSKEQNMLLFSVNGIGKSIYLKMIGLFVILSQSGMVVPADSFEIGLYHSLFTRIGDTDDLYRHLSSFAIEMNETKGILNRADENSIILADELCHGTEMFSAISIVSSVIYHLLEKNSQFVFTTHFSQVLDLIKEYKHIDIYHMTLDFDEDNKLVYTRKLKKGVGPKMYGLEVCKHMGFSIEFLKTANQYRNVLLEEHDLIVNTKKSKYNSKVYIHNCSICGKESNHLHTHHIEEQHTADESGYIQHFHKNKKFNLQILCEECHKKQHH